MQRQARGRVVIGLSSVASGHGAPLAPWGMHTLGDPTLIANGRQPSAGVPTYVVVSLLTGARTEELRALTWSRVNLDDNPPTIDSGALSEHTATRRRPSHAAHSSCRHAASKP
jgi:hypothetical protein